MKSELVQIEVELIVLKYGEPAVLKALATVTGASENELLDKIKMLKENKIKPKRAAKKQKQPIDIAKDIFINAINEHELMELANLYQNKLFLPQLKDVRRFLGRFNITKTLKSRNDATRLVFDSLIKCTNDELKGFIADVNLSENSSFATLTDQIMGTHEGKASD
jgi:hypothetical protein